MGHPNNHVTRFEDQIILSLDIDWRVINLVPFQPNPHRFGVLYASESVSEQLKCHDSMRAIVVLLKERRFCQGLARSSEFRVLFRNLLLCKSSTRISPIALRRKQGRRESDPATELELKEIKIHKWGSVAVWVVRRLVRKRWSMRISYNFSCAVFAFGVVWQDGGNKNCAILRKELLIVQLFANKKGKSTRVVWKLIDNYSNSTSETLLNCRRRRRCRLGLSLRRRWR